MGHAAAAREPSFAGLLASTLGTPGSGKAGSSAAWDLDGLEDDIAAISIESALKSRAGRDPVRPDSPAESPAGADPDLAAPRKPPLPERNPGWKRSPVSTAAHRLTIVEVAGPQPAGAAIHLKQASITIRVSKAECAQLRARAAESGMTVSAYLRSCTFEVESLRKQVKVALAQLQSAPSSATAPAAVTKMSVFGRMAQIWPRGRGEEKGASA